MSASRLSVLAIVLLASSAFAQTTAQTPPPAAPPAAIQPAPLTDADAALIVSALRGAEDQGFAPGEFGAGGPAAAIAYARAQHGGRVGRDSFPTNWALRPAAYDAAADFAAAVTQGRVSAWLADLPPTDARYTKLVQAYAAYRRIAAQGGWPAITKTLSLKQGAKGQAVETLRRRLAIEDFATPLEGTVYDAALADAVSRAQVRYGLTPDGAAGPAVLDALNVPVEQRLAQMRASLERWRWMPRALQAYRVELNIADQRLVLYDGGQPSITMKAIVGRAEKQTPTLSDEIDSIVLNPPWNVPPSIAGEVRGHRGYRVRPGGGLQQPPGPHNALGRIKFNLTNPFDVYLHDTPERALFSRDNRQLSHGCMRLEHPDELAKRLLRDDPNWPDTRLDKAIQTTRTQWISLSKAVPVYIVYWTAFVNDDGQLNLRSDDYGWDGKLQDLLGPAALTRTSAPRSG